MLVFIIICHFIIFSSTSHFTTASWDHEIHVDKNGNDIDSCLLGETPCTTVNMALKGLTSDSTLIYVSPGEYDLYSGGETIVHGMQSIALIGNNTVVKCHPLAGIKFFFSNDLSVEFITFNGCGMLTYYEAYYLQSALYILSSTNITIKNVTFMYSNGSGLLLQNIDGYMVVENCFVAYNQPNLQSKIYENKDTYLIGGGIILLGHIANGRISDTVITGNSYKAMYPSYLWNKCSYKLFHPAGVSLFNFDGNVTIDSCDIFNNSRGLFIFEDLLSDLHVKNANIHSNWDDSEVWIFNQNMNNIQLNSVSFSKTNMNNSLKVVSDTVLTSKSEWQECGYKVHYGKLLVSVVEEALSHSIIEFETQVCPDTTPVRGLCSNDGKNFTGLCPATYSTCTSDICFCIGNHANRLCGSCIDGFSVAINSPALTCTYCNDSLTIFKGWAVLIGLEFIPVTVMIALIAILNINLNQGSLNAFIFFSQMLTIPFPSVGYNSWITTWDVFEIFSFPKYNFVIFILLKIWNLDFIFTGYSEEIDKGYEIGGIPICLWKHMNPLGALSFWYFIAFYPIILLILLYVCIILYDRGYKCVVTVVKPFHRLLARFWRNYDIQPSFVHTAASVYTLCFTQLAGISLKLLHPSIYTFDSNKTTVVFFYDGTMNYSDGWHVVLVILASLILLGLIGITLYLSLYPLWCFQKCFNKTSFKKDFLISITEVFMGPFKNGTEKSTDCRYFTGCLFVLRIIVMCFYYVPQHKTYLLVVPVAQITLCCVYIGTIIIFRPYKRNIHTFAEAFLFMVLGVFSSFIFYERVYDHWPSVFGVVCYAILAVVSIYCLVWCIKKCRYRYRMYKAIRQSQRRITINQKFGDSAQNQDHHYDTDEGTMLFADRIDNPERYCIDDRH